MCNANHRKKWSMYQSTELWTIVVWSSWTSTSMLLLQASQWTIIRQLHWRVKYLFNYSCFDNVPDWHFNSTTVRCSTIQYGLPCLYNNSIRFTVFITNCKNNPHLLFLPWQYRWSGETRIPVGHGALGTMSQHTYKKERNIQWISIWIYINKLSIFLAAKSAQCPTKKTELVYTTHKNGSIRKH